MIQTEDVVLDQFVHQILDGIFWITSNVLYILFCDVLLVIDILMDPVPMR